MWKVLTNETTEALFRGGFYIDQSGSFGGDLIAVTGGDEFQGGEVWRINAQTNATRIANFHTNLLRPHLEGVITLTNDPVRWGPWAGKIITGAESELPPLVIAVNTNGNYDFYHLGIAPEDFDIIPPNQDLYCTDQVNGSLLKVPRALLTNFWGDLLVTEEGRGNPCVNFVHWTGSNFITRRLSCTNAVEHSTFAPIDIPPIR